MSRRTAHYALALALFALALPALAQRGDDSARRSKNGRLAATVDGVEVVVEYGRPAAQGREIWGALVPYGTIWRTGADEATTISFSGPVAVAGQTLAAGTYALFTIPGEERWTVIFNRQAKQWGAGNHDPAQDALRVEVIPRTAEAVERLTFSATAEGLVLSWAGVEVPVPITRGG
jgi:hypothetical protein